MIHKNKNNNNFFKKDKHTFPSNEIFQRVSFLNFVFFKAMSVNWLLNPIRFFRRTRRQKSILYLEERAILVCAAT